MLKTIITLSNGKKVGNFSSPHAFIFTDGSILPAVSNEDAERLKVTFHEIPLIKKHHSNAKEGDLMLKFTLSEAVTVEMGKWQQLFDKKQVDVVFCPLPMITAMKEWMHEDSIISSPFRSIRISDRINKLVSIDKQCI
jgi:hypothetical protein